MFKKFTVVAMLFALTALFLPLGAPSADAASVADVEPTSTFTLEATECPLAKALAAGNVAAYNQPDIGDAMEDVLRWAADCLIAHRSYSQAVDRLHSASYAYTQCVLQNPRSHVNACSPHRGDVLVALTRVELAARAIGLLCGRVQMF